MLARMPASRVNVFNIPASAPFLPVLVDALRDGRLVPGFPAGGDPLELARATIYLPTRRACRLARDVFLDRLGAEAAILPRLVPLGDIDEDEIAFAEAAAELAEAALQLPDALAGLDREMPLAALILRWAQTIAPRTRGETPLVANSPATAFALAKDLARLMDDMTTRQVDWARLDPKRGRHRLDTAEQRDLGGDRRIPKHSHARDPRCHLLEQFEPLAGKAEFG